jgi:hypothetical protein
MPLSGQIVRLGRAVTTAAAMVATSGALQVTGQPLCTVVDHIAFNLAAAQSEARKLREKAAAPINAPQHFPWSSERT